MKLHFDTVDVQKDLKAANLKEAIENFLRRYGNDENARLFIYYAGHGYTELMRDAMSVGPILPEQILR